jgi:hypothetical protein
VVLNTSGPVYMPWLAAVAGVDGTEVDYTGGRRRLPVLRHPRPGSAVPVRVRPALHHVVIGRSPGGS